MQQHITQKGGLPMECGNNTCQNIFIHKTTEELSKAFTDLWVKVINEREHNQSTIFENLRAEEMSNS